MQGEEACTMLSYTNRHKPLDVTYVSVLESLIEIKSFLIILPSSSPLLISPLFSYKGIETIAWEQAWNQAGVIHSLLS